MIELLRGLSDKAERLVSVELALFDGNERFITAVCLKFELLTAVFKANDNDDTLELVFGGYDLKVNEVFVSVDGRQPWIDLIGGKVSWGWELTNHQGYLDGVRLEFRESDTIQTRGIVEMIVAGSAIHISTVVGAF